MRTAFLAAITYFAMVFSVGFILGIVRVFLLVPSLGEQSAELLELPVMIVVSYFSAQFVVQQYSISTRQSGLTLGAISLTVLLAAEFTLALAVRDISIVEYLHTRNTLSGYVYALSLVLYGIFPLVSVLIEERDSH